MLCPRDLRLNSSSLIIGFINSACHIWVFTNKMRSYDTYWYQLDILPRETQPKYLMFAIMQKHYSTFDQRNLSVLLLVYSIYTKCVLNKQSYCVPKINNLLGMSLSLAYNISIIKYKTIWMSQYGSVEFFNTWKWFDCKSSHCHLLTCLILILVQSVQSFWDFSTNKALGSWTCNVLPLSITVLISTTYTSWSLVD